MPMSRIKPVHNYRRRRINRIPNRQWNPPLILGDTTQIPDQPEKVAEHANRYPNGCALIVLGGYSSEHWSDLYADLKPDVILGANGVNSVIDHLDYWLCSENMNYSNKLAREGDLRAIAFMEMFHRDSGAKVKLIGNLSWNLVRDKTNCISIRRTGFEIGKLPEDFSYREYGTGLMSGWVFRQKEIMRLPQLVGDVGGQLLHMAGILGCAEVHTIGFDLLLREKSRHHFYDYPEYKVDRFRNAGNFVTYRGVETQVIWIENAKFLLSMEPVMAQDGIRWIDHSEG